MDVDKLKERRLNLYDDTLTEIRSLVSLISQHKVVVFDKVPELIVDYFGEKFAVKSILIDENNKLVFLCCNRSGSLHNLFYKIDKNFEFIHLIQLFDIIEQLNKIVGHNKFNPETASKVFNFIEEHQDLSNILDYVGSGRKMSLISELDDDLISKNEDELNEYLKSISSTGDFDYYEIERILTQGKAEKEE